MAVTHTDKHFVSEDGLRLFYRVIETPEAKQTIAPVILCFPGLTRNHRDFNVIAEHLALAHYRVICPDFRGRGQSQYDPDPGNYHAQTYINDMWQLMSTEAIEEFAIIGTSLGGIMAMAMAELCPKQIRAVVLNDIGGYVPEAALRTISTYVSAAKPVSTWDEAIATVKSNNDKTFTRLSPAQWRTVTQQLYREAGNGKIHPDYDPALAQNIEVADIDLWPLFDNLAGIPTLLVRGGNSQLLSHETVERMMGLKPDMQYVCIPHQGHAPLLHDLTSMEAITGFFRHTLREARPGD